MAYSADVQKLVDDPFGGRTKDEVAALCASNLALDALAHEPPTFLLEKFCADELVSTEEAAELFEQTKRFLVVGQVLDAHIAPSLMVDKMWHAWILFTNDYHAFGAKLGGYIHHLPIPQGDAKQPPLEPTVELLEAAFGAAPEKFWPVALGAYGMMDCKQGP